MALKSPLMPSPNTNLISAFSPYTDSPSSPAPFKSLRSSGSSSNSNYLQPPPQSPLVSSPSDIADPSPIAPSSNGTDFDETALELDVETSEARPEPRRRSTETTPSLRQGEPELKVSSSIYLTEIQNENSYPALARHRIRRSELSQAKVR